MTTPTSRTLRGRDLVGLGGLLVGAVVGGLVIGLLVDQALGTSPLFVLVGVLVGIVVGRRRLLGPGPRRAARVT